MTDTIIQDTPAKPLAAKAAPPFAETGPAVDEAAPRTRKAHAEATVRRFSYYAAGAGAIPFPGLDLFTIIGVELKMVRDVALIYGVGFDEIRARAILGSVLGGLLPANAAAGVRALYSTLYRSIPGVGTIFNLVVLPASAAASNYVLGQAFIEHFEGGGTFLDIDEKAIGAKFASRTRKLWHRSAG